MAASLRLAALVAAVVLPYAAPAGAATLDDAIASALRHDPGLRQAQARRDAAAARLRQARAGRAPTLSVSAAVGAGTTDFGGFFGFGRYDLQPRSAELALTQPVFTGGALSAAVDQARAADAAAAAQVEDARLGLVADVAEAYVGVQTAEQAARLVTAQVAELGLVREQARLRFEAGEVARSDLDQAQARLSQAEAAQAGAEADLARAQARYAALVGEAPEALAPAGEPPSGPQSQAAAVAEAVANSRAVQAAKAALAAAQAGERGAEAGRWPTVALAARASSVRDQFLPGYAADGVSIGVQGRWTLFDGGFVGGRIDEARAGRREAEAALDRARAAAEQGAVDAWQARRTADLVAAAAADQARAAEAALDSVRNEVRVGARPTLDLLDAEREALAARVGAVQAAGARVVSAYRLRAVVGRAETP